MLINFFIILKLFVLTPPKFIYPKNDPLTILAEIYMKK